MIIEDYLQKIGLTEKEAKLYIAGLQNGPSTIQELANESGLKRTTIYEIVDSLKEKKLINTSLREKKKIFIMEEPENVGLFLRQRENIFNKILPELEALKNMDTKKPMARIYEGRDGLEKIYEDMIKKPGTILVLAAPKDLILPGLLDYLKNDWEFRRIKNGIDMRRVNINLTGNKHMDYKIKPNPEECENIKYLPIDNYPFTVGIYIYRKKVAFVSYQHEEMFGTILRSPAICLTMKALFENFWQMDRS
ncbi:MAG: hypothetical protein A2571_00520 [Candidatus Vogelbacteria bacterium RIFOXYD1_FULL_44_32]|uniref:Transcription regulator TrmB N-terminal domain-containing protein n=1 Tax=Candidatus Vogelbacteria bacterium RIFOXYD1_FULL_44_32 TaxID=1802438 RepID=A0A1G2QE23_9BACT|nr:MAG: hypothetical protein A2571_00520 [Candidatus Vogelbacteria bacterium RIFOXYD1_FULL_44_32]